MPQGILRERKIVRCGHLPLSQRRRTTQMAGLHPQTVPLVLGLLLQNQN
jgi:hypothetical protein